MRNRLLLIAERVLLFIARHSMYLANDTMQKRGLADTQFIIIVSPNVRTAVGITSLHTRQVSADRGKGGEGKMLRLLRHLRKIPLLSELEGSVPAKKGWKPYTNKSQLRWIAETAIQVGEGRLRLVG